MPHSLACEQEISRLARCSLGEQNRRALNQRVRTDACFTPSFYAQSGLNKSKRTSKSCSLTAQEPQACEAAAALLPLTPTNLRQARECLLCLECPTINPTKAFVCLYPQFLLDGPSKYLAKSGNASESKRLRKGRTQAISAAPLVQQNQQLQGNLSQVVPVR